MFLAVYGGQFICDRVSYFVFSVCFLFAIVQLSVPVQLIAWKDSSLK